MKNIKKLILVVSVSFILLFLNISVLSYAQTNGSSSSESGYIYGTISDKATGKPLFGALLTLYDSNGKATTQKANSGGGFAFIKPLGSYSLYGSVTGYQSNVCFFTQTSNPTEVTFLLSQLGNGGSSCSSKMVVSTPTPAIGDGTQGPGSSNSSGGVDTTVSSPSTAQSNTTSSSDTNVTVNADGTVTSYSNCIVTKVGNPRGEPVYTSTCPKSSTSPGLPPGSGNPGNPSLNDFVRIAEQIKSAYDVCEEGLTFDSGGLASCLKNSLSKNGFSSDQLDNFETRREHSLVYHEGPTGSGNCTECLGYVGTVVALWANTSVPEETLNTLETAGSLNDCCNVSGFEAGGKHWRPLGKGVSVQIQPGDIAVAGSAYNGDHIGIVHDVIDDATMNLIESNGGYDCRISTSRGYPIPKELYTFYRAQ